eukprot:6276482-Ditylum_brightwellii.AAC.1
MGESSGEAHGNLRKRKQNQEEKNQENDDNYGSNDEKKEESNDANNTAAQNQNTTAPATKPKERHLDPANVIGGYRPTSLMICENDDVNERHIHLVTVTKRRRCHRNVDSVSSMDIDDDENDGNIRREKEEG